MDKTVQFLIALAVGALLLWGFTTFFGRGGAFPNSGDLQMGNVQTQIAKEMGGDQIIPSAMNVAGGYQAGGYDLGAPLAPAPDNAAPTTGVLQENLASTSLRETSCYPKAQLTAQELLPNDNDTLWAQVNPGTPGSLTQSTMAQAGLNFGIDTVGQSLRNASLDLRSEPPNVQVTVSPWNQTTIGPDTNRRQFEIGTC